ncbi:unnamed protein product [Aphanomyces euteiches]
MDACRAIANLRDEWANRCEEQIQALQQRIARTLSPSVVEVTNVGAGHEQRREDTPNRMLKFCLTDGYTLAFAIEYKRLNNLSATTPRGTKIIIENVQIRHGLLMLTSVVVLGASGNSELETLDAATIPQDISSSVAEVEEDKEALSDEERATDPTIRHLFYGSPLPHKEHPSLAPSRSNSVASFDFASGMFDLKVFVEDGTRSLLVSVDPQFVETLMGVSCAVFVQAMTNNIDQGMRWVTHMQNQLSTMEGLMTIEFNSTVLSLDTGVVDDHVHM